MQTVNRRRLWLAATAVVLIAAWDQWFLLPLRLLVVTFHELGHAAVALATGGRVVSVSVGLDEGGATLTQGGWRFGVLNGGYLGSLLLGVALLVITRRPSVGRAVAGGLGLALLGAGLAWFQWLSAGFLLVALSGVGLVALAARAPASMATGVLRLVGLFSVMYAILDIRDDVFFGSGRSDAAMLADATGIPAFVWGLAWLWVGAGVIWRLRDRLV